MLEQPVMAIKGAEVVLARELDEFAQGTSGIVVEVDATRDLYQLRIDTNDGAAFLEARRRDFSVLLDLPRPVGDGDGIGYTSDTDALMRRYGISAGQYDALLTAQEGCCGICHRHSEVLRKPLVVDHNHRTGEVRGLLCDNCNIGLGHFLDRIDLLESAIDYLRDNGAD